MKRCQAVTRASSIQALRHIGQKFVDNATEERLRCRLSDDDKNYFKGYPLSPGLDCSNYKASSTSGRALTSWMLFYVSAARQRLIFEEAQLLLGLMPASSASAASTKQTTPRSGWRLS